MVVFGKFKGYGKVVIVSENVDFEIVCGFNELCEKG